MLIQKKKIKNRREETKIDSEIEKKNGEKWLLGFGHFFWAGVYEVVKNFLRRIYFVIIIFTYFLFPLKFNLLLIILL